MKHLLALITALLLILPAPLALAAPEELDFGFGEAGLVRVSSNFSANRLLRRGDGRIVAVGSVQQGIQLDLAVAQFLPDGPMDTSFSGDGFVATALSGTDRDTGRAVVEQPDGKLLVLAQRGDFSDFDVVVVRYNVNGSLDGTFGTSGRAIPAISSGDVFASGLALLPSDKLLLLTTVDEGAGRELALVRLGSNGALDTTFQGTGIVRTALAGGIQAAALFVLGDGKILVVGRTTTATTQQLVLVRYLADGSLDPMFGTGGISTKPLPEGLSQIEDVVRLADGRIVIGGRPDGLGILMRVWRFLQDGTSDSSFGTGGVAVASFGRSSETGSASLRAMALQPDGKIVVVGQGLEYARYTNFDLPAPNDLIMARFTADGALDEGFGVGGTVTLDFAFGNYATDVAVHPDGRILTAVSIIELASDPGGSFAVGAFLLARFFGGEGAMPPPPPVFDTTSTVTREPVGTLFSGFSAPAVDGGQVGGLATITGGPRPQTVIYGSDGAVQVRTSGLDPVGAQFIELGDPVFAGEALGFAGMARQPAPPMSLPLRMDRRLGTERVFSVRPGGRLAALYSQLTKATGIKRLAAQADPAPGGGQFAKFGGFGLPRTRGGLVFTAKLHRSDGVTAKDDFGIWREKTGGGDSDKLVRTGDVAGSRTVRKLSLLTPVANATDQRRSFAPDGGVAAVASFDDGSAGVVTVAVDGSVAVPLGTASDVPAEDGGADASAEFVSFSPPATASGGRLALLAALKAAARGLPAPPSQAIFSNQGGTMRRVVARGDAAPGRNGVRFGALGQPLLGQQGMIGFIAALTGRRVTPANRTAVAFDDNGVRAVVARLGDPAVGAGGRAVYRRFMSALVTDSDPARLLFTATIGGPRVSAANNVGLWSVSRAAGSSLILRKGGTIMVGGLPLTVRTLEALQAPRKSVGQGRSSDADGFVTAKVKLSDRRQGVLRIPLP